MTLSSRSRQKRRLDGVLRSFVWLFLLFLTVLLPSFALGQQAPRSPDTPWLQNGPELTRNLAVVGRHEAELDGQHVYSLGDLIDVAELNNPTTRAAWYRAKANAASVGIAKSELYPTIIATAGGSSIQSTALLNQTQVLQNFGMFEAALHLDYTLLDFGARRSEITSRQAQLVAANLSFNNEHLMLIEKVSGAYYRMLNAIGLRKAAEVSLRDAKALEMAAEDRRANGLATVPEVLEAKAATANANYDLQSALGAERVVYGHLATALTATPLKQFQVETLEDLHIPDHLDQSVEDAIAVAFRDRPDLQADEAKLRSAEAEVKHAKTAYYPTFTFEGAKGWLRAWAQQEPYPGSYAQTKVYDATLGVKWTVFDGFRRESRIAGAKAEEAAAKDEVHDRQDQITDQVWENYITVETALKQREAAIALLAAANESYSASLESYKDGVRDFLDVLQAETQLARARAINVTASTEVLKAFTGLAFRTGDLLTNHVIH